MRQRCPNVWWARLQPLLQKPSVLETKWEAAWTMMVKRQRAGLAPAPFDVPEQTDSTPLFRV